MVMVKTNSQLIEEEKAAAAERVRLEDEAQKAATPQVPEIVGYVRTRWEAAKRAKITTVEPQMFSNIRQATNKYDPKKLAAIREMGGSEIYIQYTKTKCRNLIAWIRDILFQPNQKPWGVDHTPNPELSPGLMEAIQSSFISTSMNKVLASAGESEQPLDMSMIISTIQEQMPALQEEIKSAVLEKAGQKANEMEVEINDKLVEGGWNEALYQCIPDLVVVKNAFVKGPIKRYRNVRKIVKGEDGKDKLDVVKELVREYERRSPFDIYPEPDSSGINDGYLFDHVSYRRRDLAALIGVEGFNENEIRLVLQESRNGGLREWTGIESDRATFNKQDTQAVYNSDKIDALEYYGPVPGTTLIQWGTKVDDVDIDYEATIVLIGNHVIQAVVNNDPLGHKPYSTAGYDEDGDSFWADTYCESLEDVQGAVNACSRAIINNVGMGSGPQVEINTDRLMGGLKGDTRLIPWRKWLTTNRMQQQGNAINFWQPQMHAQEILTVLNAFSKMGDERGVPAYGHGDPQVGGAGNTASGLSMLITQSTRVTKGAIKNIDMHLIIPSIQNQYDDLLADPKYLSKIGDVKLVAKGSSALIEKEQKAVRMVELLAQTNNNLDAQITGLEGRAYLLGEVAKTHEIDPDKILRGITRGPAVAQPGGPTTAMAATGSPPGAANTDVAGNVPSGASSQLITGQGGQAASPPA